MPPLHKFGYRISIFTVIITVITFAIAVSTPPLSGPFCKADCFQYPFTDILSRFPRDYYWMYPAMLMVLGYMVMMITLHQAAPEGKRHLTLSGVAFAVMATLTLFADYFIQVSVIQPSLLNGEHDGISLLSQFNPHGLFIVLEENGLTFMAISFLFISAAVEPEYKGKRAIQITAVAGILLTIVSFVAITAQFGIFREYRFEVAVITITWLQLIILGIMFARYFSSHIPDTGKSIS